ncbi:MAG: cyclic nucleotide-binding domain-containing protein [Cyanobacteria bacterium P01_F01_bin.150]
MKTILDEFCSQDIDWFLARGTSQTIAPHTVIIEADESPHQLYLVLEGGLAVELLNPENADQALEISRISSGEIWGFLPGLPHFLPPARVRAVVPSTLLSIPKEALTAYVAEDADFAVRFYQFTLQLLNNRLEGIAQRCGYSLDLLTQLQLKEAVTVFGALEDGDLDWLISVGDRHSLEPGSILVQRGRPLDGFHIVLNGAIALSAPEQVQAPMVAAFGGVAVEEKEFARLTQGSVVGEGIFVDTYPPLFTARAIRDTTVLSIPRWRLMARLLYDADFAARIYRVLGLLLANKQQQILERIGERIGFSLGIQELDHELLAKLSLAEARFEWMVKRLQQAQVTARIQ